MTGATREGIGGIGAEVKLDTRVLVDFVVIVCEVGVGEEWMEWVMLGATVGLDLFARRFLSNFP